MTDGALHYAMTHYLLRRAQENDGVTIYREPAASPVSVGGESVPMASGEMPVAHFDFDPNRWALITTLHIYYRAAGQFHRYEAEAIKHVALNIIPRVTNPTTLDEIKLSFSTGSDAIIKARAGMSVNLLYATIVRVVRGNRKDAVRTRDLVAATDDVAKPISGGVKALFRL